jgi:HD-GYP domain-containing protein (c-di-GMP phosphodiesterase class II)
VGDNVFKFPCKKQGRRVDDLLENIRWDFAPCFLNHHPLRVAKIAAMIAEAQGYSKSWQRMITVVAAFHDIGKVHPECQHLYTSGFLRYDEEFRKIVTAEHQRRGPEVLGRIKLWPFERYRKRIEVVCAHHHDDFKYFPKWRREVYLVAVADAWDALTSAIPGEERERGYRSARAPEEAAEILYEEALKGKFDPNICIALVEGVMGMEQPKVYMPTIQSMRRNRA